MRHGPIELLKLLELHDFVQFHIQSGTPPSKFHLGEKHRQPFAVCCALYLLQNAPGALGLTSCFKRPVRLVTRLTARVTSSPVAAVCLPAATGRWGSAGITAASGAYARISLDASLCLISPGQLQQGSSGGGGSCRKLLGKPSMQGEVNLLNA